MGERCVRVPVAFGRGRRVSGSGQLVSKSFLAMVMALMAVGQPA